VGRNVELSSCSGCDQKVCTFERNLQALSSVPKEVKRVSRHDSVSCFFSLSKRKECEDFQQKTLTECDFVFAAHW
jgi:hypothetical protein